MTEKKVLKAEGVGELVGAVTALLGYTPAQSLIIAPLTGTRATSAMRVDLPTNAEAYPAMVAQVMGLTCRVPGVTGFAAVIYTDGADSEHEGLAATLLSAASFRRAGPTCRRRRLASCGTLRPRLPNCSRAMACSYGRSRARVSA